jgi:two-component system cell cycle sensor histidine kinase/response regulator CckA
MRRLLRLISAAFGTDEDIELRLRFYRGICFLIGALAAFAVPAVNALQDLPAIVSIGSFLLGAIALGLYLAARRGHYYPTWLLIAVIVTLVVGWFPNAASSGSIAYYFFATLLYPVLFFDGRRRKLGLAAVLSTGLLMLWLDYQFPGLATPFKRPLDRALDLLTGFLVSGFACVLMFWAVISVYHRERERLTVTVGALAASREQFSKLFELNPDAVCLVDPVVRRYLDANAGFERLTGWCHDDVVGHPSEDVAVWVNDEDRVRMFHQLQAEGHIQGFVARFRHREGREFWGSTSAGWIDVGGHQCMLLSTRDVSEPIEAQQAVAESRALLSALIDNTDDPVWMVDPVDYGLMLFNSAFEQSMERVPARKAALGLRPADLLPPDAAAVWSRLYDRARAEGAFTIEYAVPGTDRTLLHSINPVKHDGKLVGFSVFGKDITEGKRAEDERDRMALQLLEAQKMESLGSLAGGVAHDFNNMLGGIMGYADLLLSEESDPGRQEYIKAILQAASRSSDLTKKLLAFARRGKNIVEAVDLGALIAECVGMLRPSFRPDVAVEVRAHSNWTVDGDPSQLNQLLVNLCINANEAMPRGGTLTIVTSDAAIDGAACLALNLQPGDYVLLRVSDSGVGMTEEVKSRIFEPFFTTKTGRSAAGTGLGLATVYGIVHLHHGAISVESAAGAGSSFAIYLPKGALTREQIAAETPRQEGTGLILVVEDEPLLRSFTTAALARLGYRTLTADDGEDGVGMFRTHHRDLTGVILDLKMPKKDGREAFYDMRSIDPSVPVLICSGYGDNEEAQGLITLGAKGLLPKPFRLADLSKQLELMRL